MNDEVSKESRKLSTLEIKKILKKRSKAELIKTCIDLADKIDELKEHIREAKK